MLALGGVVIAIKIGALLGEDQPGPRALCQQLNRRQGDGDTRVVQMHVIAEDNALRGHNVLISGIKGMDRPTLRPTATCFAPAHPKVHLMLIRTPFFRATKPASLGLRL